MVAQIIDGRKFAAAFNQETQQIIVKRQQQGLVTPGLAVILVGDNPASSVYVKNKRERCLEVGINSFFHPLAATIEQAELLNLINDLNRNDRVHGILVQLPLPSHIDSDIILDAISPAKDVDGFHPYNLGRLAQRRPNLRPCTPYGVMQLLDKISIAMTGKEAVVVGASNIVGRPMALELLMAGATVTICHRRTQHLEQHVKRADILISAVGQPNFISGEWIKPGAVVIDIGITRLQDGSLTGDIDFTSAKQYASWITPVPGGVGPMTVAMLMRNTLQAAIAQTQKDSA